MTRPTLYPHQLQVKRDLYQRIRDGDKRIIVKAATGFGKTILAIDIIHDAMSKGIGVVFAVPTLTLVDQSYKEFTEHGLDCGIIQADNILTDYAKPVQIASIQTIAAHIKKNKAGLKAYYADKMILIDESHIQFAAANYISKLTSSIVFGFTATPWAKGMAEKWDSVVSGPSVSWLIDNGHLSKYRAYSHYVPDMKGVRLGADGDYSKRESGEKYESKIIGDIVQTWRKHAEGRQTILFAPRVADAERFAEEFRLAGYESVAVNGYMDSEDCAVEVEKFKNHETMILCSVSKLTTGFNVRDIGCIIDCKPCKSLITFVQSYGRGLRTHEDKADLIILDNAGNILRNGMPCDDSPDELMSGSAKNKLDRKPAEAPLPKACPKCNCMKTTHKCPNCGFAPEARSELEIEAGELVEVKKASKSIPIADKLDFYAQLKGFAREKGYKDGWAYHKFYEKYQVYPTKTKQTAAIAPTAEVRGFIQHLNIRNAKRRTA